MRASREKSAVFDHPSSVPPDEIKFCSFCGAPNVMYGYSGPWYLQVRCEFCPEWHRAPVEGGTGWSTYENEWVDSPLWDDKMMIATIDAALRSVDVGRGEQRWSLDVVKNNLPIPIKSDLTKWERFRYNKGVCFWPFLNGFNGHVRLGSPYGGRWITRADAITVADGVAAAIPAESVVFKLAGPRKSWTYQNGVLSDWQY